MATRSSSPDMVRRYASTYNSEQAARRHGAFSPAERLGSRVQKRRFYRNRTEDSESKGLTIRPNPMLPKQRVASSTLVSRSNPDF